MQYLQPLPLLQSALELPEYTNCSMQQKLLMESI